MLSPEQFGELLTELRGIRLALESRPVAPPASALRPATAASNSTPANVDASIPQPDQIIPDAGNVQIHFGKNTGKALTELTDRSLSWYATEQPARLDSNGQPYPRRPQETHLLNAARTVYHTQHGTLIRPGDPLPPKVEPKKTPNLDEDPEVPF